MTNAPFPIFDRWFEDAKASEPIVPEAMSLATVDASGRPSTRMVLLKKHGPEGFVFYTNLDSRKSIEISDNPNVALLFHWKSLKRQVRIEGLIEAVSDSEADAYFATRDRESQLGAWASHQSQPLPSREVFDERFEEMSKRFEGGDVPRPPFWSGFRVVPERIEFWEDRAHRLHDRHLFTRCNDIWTEGLLFP